MEHFLIFRLLFWIAMFAFIILSAFICMLVEKLFNWRKALKGKIDARLTKKEIHDRPSDDSLDRLAA